MENIRTEMHRLYLSRFFAAKSVNPIQTCLRKKKCTDFPLLGSSGGDLALSIAVLRG